jgi:hypothetical protein
MKISGATQKSYPKFTYYLRHDMPKVANVTSIVNAIKALSGTTSKATIWKALKWGNEPEIKIVPNLICAGVKAYGCYTFGATEIRVDKQLVDDFEAGLGITKTASGRRVYLLGVTLLHELTHWADSQDGVDDPVDGDPSNEEGNAYEKGVYGKVLP